MPSRLPLVVSARAWVLGAARTQNPVTAGARFGLTGAPTRITVPAIVGRAADEQPRGGSSQSDYVAAMDG
jgi:hypothetical protein